MLTGDERQILSRTYRFNIDEEIHMMYLHAIVRCYDRVVSVYQRAFATSDGDGGLQAAALRAWG